MPVGKGASPWDKDYSPGSKRILKCPNCDGEGKEEINGQLVDCKTCNGKGNLEGTVVKQ